MDRKKALKFTNPATGEVFGEIAMTTSDEVNQVNAELRARTSEWAGKPVRERIRLLRRFQGVLIAALDEITAVINQDCGKSRQDALIEAFVTVDVLQHQLKHAQKWLRRKRVSSGLYVFKRCYVEPRPHGLVGVIAPWNYPLALSLPPVLSALLAGNTVMLKPSEVTPATGALIETLFGRIPELAKYVRVLHGDGSVGAAMVDSGVEYIFLTGSPETGRVVMKNSAKTLTPVACELGGKDPMIVMGDADINAAAKWGVWGAFFNAGQTCMAVERVYVQDSVYDSFVEKVVEEVQRLQVGYSSQKRSPYYLGPISDPRQLKIIQRHLEDALQKGAKILTGGKSEGNFIEPTILVDIDHDMLVMQEETFGPLMPIMKVRDIEEAIRLANDSRYGLGASIWSENLERAERVAEKIQAGTILINDTIAQFAVPALPFGGIKDSGSGRIHGKEGLLQFTLPHSYAVGQTPLAWDIATIAREPGRYGFIAGVLRLVFGVSLEQRIQPLEEALEKKYGLNNPQRITIGVGAVIGALAGALIVWKKFTSKPVS